MIIVDLREQLRRIGAKLASRIRFLFYGLYSRVRRSRIVRLESGLVIEIRTSTEHEVFRALTFFTKEPETLAWIDSFPRQGKQDPVLFDIGANIGVYSLYAAATIPAARIFSFEPESQSFASLCQNVGANDFSRITPYQFALSDEVGLGDLHISTMSAGAGAAALGEDYRFMNTGSRRIARQGVFVSSVDHLVYELGLPFPDFIKIDVDGIELKILAGAKRVLADPRLQGLLVEMQYESDADIEALVAARQADGLTLSGKSIWEGHYQSGLNSRNFIFRRQPAGGDLGPEGLTIQ